MVRPTEPTNTPTPVAGVAFEHASAATERDGGCVFAMTSSLEGYIQKAARLLVDRHGAAAAVRAAIGARTALEAGDMEARAVWLGVMRAVREMSEGGSLRRLGDGADRNIVPGSLTEG